MQFLILVLIVLGLLSISVFPNLYADVLRRVVGAKKRIKNTGQRQ